MAAPTGKRTNSRDPARRRLRSRFLLKPGEFEDEPFRQSYIMHFPPAEQKMLRLLGRLLYYKEDLQDRYCPVYKGSHNLAHLHAAMADLRSVAKTLAEAAEAGLEDSSRLEMDVAPWLDAFAVKIARLAAEIEKAIETLVLNRPSRSSRKKSE